MPYFLVLKKSKGIQMDEDIKEKLGEIAALPKDKIGDSEESENDMLPSREEVYDLIEECEKRHDEKDE